MGAASSLDLLLAICPCWSTAAPPIGLAHLSAYLRARGVGVALMDLNIELYRRAGRELRALWAPQRAHHWWLPERYEAEIRPALEPLIEHAARRLAEHPAPLLGLSVFVANRLFTRDVLCRLRKLCNKTVVVGGRGVFDAHERGYFPREAVDYFCVGDGEEPLLLLSRGEPGGPGLMRPGDPPPSPALFEGLGEMPAVTYDDFPMQRYTDHTLTVLLNRGCSFRCAFCNDWGYIGKRRTRQPQALFAELEHYFYVHGVNEIYFNDQAINVNLEALGELCRLMARTRHVMEWVALAIPNRSLDAELLTLMRAAGCKTLNFGVESGSQVVLKLMRKGLRVGEVEQVLQRTHRAGINATVNMVVGFPGETEAEFQRSLDFLERTRPFVTGVTNANMFDAIIGCDVERRPERYGVEIPDEPRPRYRNWRTLDGENTLAVRQERVRRLMDHAARLGLPVLSTNLY